MEKFFFRIASIGRTILLKLFFSPQFIDKFELNRAFAIISDKWIRVVYSLRLNQILANKQVKSCFVYNRLCDGKIFAKEKKLNHFDPVLFGIRQLVLCILLFSFRIILFLLSPQILTQCGFLSCENCSMQNGRGGLNAKGLNVTTNNALEMLPKHQFFDNSL